MEAREALMGGSIKLSSRAFLFPIAANDQTPWSVYGIQSTGNDECSMQNIIVPK